MPTGYTHKVCDGTVTDFNSFALECALAFGACIHQRDGDPGPPTMPTLSLHNKNAMDKANDELAAITATSDLDMDVQAGAAYLAQCAEYERSKTRWQAEQDRISEMEAKVSAWEPPTPDHRGLRDFMLQQLDISKSPAHYMQPPARMSADEYRAKRIADTSWNVTYHTKEWQKEQERHAGRCKWIIDLYTSLGLEPPKEIAK